MRLALCCLAAALVPASLPAQRPVYDRVILGGRVMDPESGLDAPRNIGIRGGTIAVITPARLAGRDTIDAMGLVVAPGFIDLHDHWQTPAGYRFASLDGVSEVYSVTGTIDLIALVRVREHEDVATVVADRLNKVEGVTETETHIAFRTYSQHDLESAFSIGLD